MQAKRPKSLGKHASIIKPHIREFRGILSQNMNVLLERIIMVSS